MSTPMGERSTMTGSDRPTVSTGPSPSPTGAADPTNGQFDASTNVEDASVGALVGEVLNDLSTLMRKEIELAKAEISQEAAKAAKGAGMLAGAAAAGWFTLMFLSFTLIWALWDMELELWAAALIVTALWGIGAAVLASLGRKKLKTVNPKPEQTVQSLKEDVQWAKAQNK